jgi:hypothetical protein
MTLKGFGRNRSWPVSPYPEIWLEEPWKTMKVCRSVPKFEPNTSCVQLKIANTPPGRLMYTFIVLGLFELHLFPVIFVHFC